MDRLKLIAMDEEDLRIVSAHVQDAVARSADLAFDAKAGKFALALNRYVWERDRRVSAEKRRTPERRRAMLHFERVTAARSTGIERAGEQVLSLLAVGFVPDGKDDAAGTIELTFSGDAAVRLEVECIEARLTDTEAAWAARARPDHDADLDQP